MSKKSRRIIIFEKIVSQTRYLASMSVSLKQTAREFAVSRLDAIDIDAYWGQILYELVPDFFLSFIKRSFHSI